MKKWFGSGDFAQYMTLCPGVHGPVEWLGNILTPNGMEMSFHVLIPWAKCPLWE